MLLIPCPWCGPRPEIEFKHAGEAHISRPVAESVTDREWGDFLYARDNPKGPTFERWRHAHGCGAFFNAERDTVTDRISRTYRPGTPRPEPTKSAVDGRYRAETP